MCPCDQVTETEPSNESRHGVCSCDQQVNYRFLTILGGGPGGGFYCVVRVD